MKGNFPKGCGDRMHPLFRHPEFRRGRSGDGSGKPEPQPVDPDRSVIHLTEPEDGVPLELGTLCRGEHPRMACAPPDFLAFPFAFSPHLYFPQARRGTGIYGMVADSLLTRFAVWPEDNQAALDRGNTVAAFLPPVIDFSRGDQLNFILARLGRPIGSATARGVPKSPEEFPPAGKRRAREAR